ncbi:MAG: hypothetical protein JXA23_06165 [Bacteroidales bacterium]|nr:hypothetical protein [Bacteroidales bacterium]
MKYKNQLHRERLASPFFSIALIALLSLISWNANRFDTSLDLNNSRRFQPPSITPNDWMALQRIYPYDRIRPEVYQSAINQSQALIDQGMVKSTPWVFTGPTNIGGRITDIEVPDGDMQTIYIGGSTGGVLKTTDGGSNWANLFGDIPVVSIGDIAINPTNPDILYVGTGEANSSSFSFWGNGIYKSIDAGETWQHMGLENSAYIGRILVDYDNEERVFVAACGYLFSYNDQRGVYRSMDGGMTWDRVLYLTDSTAAIDLVQHPADPDILYAAMWERTRGLEYRNSFGVTSGIWKTTDGGDTWTELANGLMSGQNVGRIGLTICTSQPDILYAVYDLPDFEVAVFKTTDGGQSWTRTNDGSLNGMCSNFGWYFGQIRVDPNNPDKVYVMGVPLMATQNGGVSWNEVAENIHVDHHAMVIDAATSAILEGNDGGLYSSLNNGITWSKINNLPLTQFYAIDIDYQLPNRIYGGTQDNNTIRTLTGNLNDWQPLLGGDGMYTLVDYTNSNIIYAEYQWGNLYRSTNGGYNMQYIGDVWAYDRVNWSAPLAMHPEDPAILYFGTYRVWKSFDRGSNWTPVSGDLTQGIDQYFHTITTIAISPVTPSTIFVGTGDAKVQVSTNDGLTWTDVSAGLPNRWVTRVVPDPFDDQTLYVTLSGFRWDEPLPHVYKSTNLGQSWEAIAGNLPEFPVNDMVADPDMPDKLIVATDAGLYGTFDGGESWQWIWTDLPAVPTYALKVHVPTRTIVAGTYGLSTYSANLDDIFTGVAVNPTPRKGHLTVTPNPVSGSSIIRFFLPESDYLTCSIFGMDGKRNGADRMIPGTLDQGDQTIRLDEIVDVSQIPAGVYLVVLSGNRIRLTGEIVVL